MVAELDGKLVGSILYTVSTLTAEDGTVKKCLTFGPHRRASGTISAGASGGR